MDLDQLDEADWEALCDGCGRCCLLKLIDEDTQQLHYTNVACRLLDLESCRCRNYASRSDEVPDCLDIRTLPKSEYQTLPKTCAYRRVYEGRGLPDWHPLKVGTKDAVHEAGISVRGRVLSETYIHPEQLPFQTAEWPEQDDE